MENMTLILTSIIMGAAGQILLKIGADRLGGININIEGIFSIIRNYYILTGLLFFGLSFLLWVKVLTKNDLSYVYPMVSISYIIIILASRFFLDEPFTLNKIIGIIAIITGVYIINQ